MSAVTLLTTCWLLMAVTSDSMASPRASFPGFLSQLKEESANEVDGAQVQRVVLPSDPDQPGQLLCQMDVKISRQVTGRCVKLGPDSDACVAGSYVHPFHHDCI